MNKNVQKLIKGIPNGAKVIHFHPIAYCIAKSERSLMFAIPPQINKCLADEITYEKYVLVSKYKCEKEFEKTSVGDFKSVCYISSADSGQRIVLPFQPNIKVKYTNQYNDILTNHNNEITKRSKRSRKAINKKKKK